MNVILEDRARKFDQLLNIFRFSVSNFLYIFILVYAKLCIDMSSTVSLYTSVCNYLKLRDNGPKDPKHVQD